MRTFIIALCLMLGIAGAQAQVITLDTTQLFYREFRSINPFVSVSGLNPSLAYTANWWYSEDGGVSWYSTPSSLIVGSTSTGNGYQFCGDSSLIYYFSLREGNTNNYWYFDTVTTVFSTAVDDGFGLHTHIDGGPICADSTVYWSNIYYGAPAELVTFVTRNSTNQGFTPDWIMDTMILQVNGVVVSTGYTKILASNGWENFVSWHVVPGTILNNLDTLEIWVGNVMQDGFMWMGIDNIVVEDITTGNNFGPEGCSFQGWIFSRDQWSCPGIGPTTGPDSIYFEFDTVAQYQIQTLWYSASANAEIYLEEMSTGNIYFVGFGYGDGIMRSYDLYSECDRDTNYFIYVYDSFGLQTYFRSFVETDPFEFSAYTGTSNVTIQLSQDISSLGLGDTIVVYIDLFEIGPFFNTLYASKTINLQDTTITFSGLAPQKPFTVSVGYSLYGIIYGPNCEQYVTTDPCGAGHILEYENGNLLFSYPSYMAGSVFTVYASSQGQGSPFILEVPTPATAVGGYLLGMEILSVALPIGNATFDLLSPCGDTETYHATVGVEQIEDETVSTVSVYPNPTSGWVTIETEELNQNYRVTDVTGRILMGGLVTDNVTKVDVSELPAGMYLISVGNETKKLIKL